MLDTVMSAGSTSSTATSFSRRRMKRSLADELDGAFQDIDPDLSNIVGTMEDLEGNRTMEDTRNSENQVPEMREHSVATQSQLTPRVIANAPSDSCFTLEADDHMSPATNSDSNTMLDQPFQKTKFTEHLSLVDPSSKPLSLKEQTKLMASIHNRNLIDRGTDGFFNMEAMPSNTDVQRRIQQSEGITALQRTLVPATVSDTASTSTGSSPAPSSRATDSVKPPSTLRKITFATPRDRKHSKIQSPPPTAASRSKAGPRFSLGRHLVAASHHKKMAAPSAPARFVRLPTDPLVSFRRDLAERGGLTIVIPRPNPAEPEKRASGSVTSVPDVDSAGNLQIRNEKPQFDFGVPRGFLANQCVESSCPLRFAHAKGPYHHKGQRGNNIMTGLFGHSNPPPEIWNLYRNMVHMTSDGEMTTPDPRPRPNADDDLVIAFAMFHYGSLNTLSGDEFHKRYADRHTSSKISQRSTSNNSSRRSCSSWKSWRF